MNELTKERLQEIAEDGFLKHGEGKAMALQLLASIEQEPVAYNGIMPDYVGVDMTQRECYQAGLEAGKAAMLPAGYVVVPLEPTEEILDEFDSIIDYGAEDSKDAWKRLIAAAPQQEVPKIKK